MRKTFKKLVAMTLLTVGVVSATLMTSAKSSPWIESPATTCGTWTTTNDNIQVVSSDQVSITADRVHLQIRNFETLPIAFSTAPRTAKMYVYDEDTYNADDLIRKYNAEIYWRSFVRIVADSSFSIPGQIDKDGENQAQLYLSFMIPKVAGDPTQPCLYSGIFDYRFYVVCE